MNQGLFVADEEPNQRRMLSAAEAAPDSGNQMIVENISGDYYTDLSLTIQPGTNTIIIGDNVKARKELIHDLAHPKAVGGNGTVRLPRGTRVEYVTPSATDVADPEITLKDFFFEARGINGVEAQIAALWEKVGANPDDEAAMAEAGNLQTKFEEAGGWEAEREIGFLLEGLNVAGNAHDQIGLETKLGHMSSGQISKAIIAKALFSRAGVIVMDDPSVHLDVYSKQWLADYIKSSNQATIIATSDMEFATHIGDRVVEILDSKLALNIGTNLDNYGVEREKLINNWLDVAGRRKEEIDALAIQIRDFYRPAAKKTDNMAQVLRAQVSKLNRMTAEYEKMPGKILMDSKQREQKPRTFQVGEQSGNDVFIAEGMDIMYESDDPERDGTIIEVPKLGIYKGDRLAVIGNNGSGKSTLMRAIAGETQDMLVEGATKKGPSVETGYYSTTTTLPAEDMPLRQILGRHTRDAMGILAFWGFDRTENYDTKPADLLDRDEIARAQFALLMAKHPNLLMLDEPTAYLTPSYQDKLVDAVKAYDGTLMVISHDPAFLAKLGLKGRIVMPGAKREDF